MKKELKRVSVALLAGLLVATQLSGCSTVSGLFGKGKDTDGGPTYEELQQQIATLNSQVIKDEEQITSLKELLYTYDSTLSQVADLDSVRRLPTGQKAYNSINNYIRLGEQLELKPSMVLPNDTTIQLVKNVVYKPTNNWSFDLSNGTVSLLHKNGMYVTLRAYDYIGDSTPYDVYDTVIKPYLDGLSMTELSRRTLFMKDQTVGTLVFNQCFVVEQEDGTKDLKVPETVAETEESAEESTTAETGASGETLGAGEETTDATDPTTGTSANETPLVQVTAPTGAPISLDDLLGGETTAPESEAQETESTNATDSTDPTGETESTQETEAEETKAQTVPEPKPVKKDKVSEYRYVIGVVLDGSTGIIFEAFYPNDDTASIQEELLETCLNGLYIRGNQLKSQ